MKEKVLEKMEKINEGKKIDEKTKSKIKSIIFDNIIIAIDIVALFIILSISSNHIQKSVMTIICNSLSIIMLLYTIVLFELAYKKDSGKLAMHGIELLALSIITLFTSYMLLEIHTQQIFLVGVYFTIYYVVKILYLCIKEKNKHVTDVSDIKEIVKKESKDKNVEEFIADKKAEIKEEIEDKKEKKSSKKADKEKTNAKADKKEVKDTEKQESKKTGTKTTTKKKTTSTAGNKKKKENEIAIDETAEKKTTAKKTTTGKTTAKKTTTKKAVTDKTLAPKTPVKKTTTNKTVEKKTSTAKASKTTTSKAKTTKTVSSEETPAPKKRGRPRKESNINDKKHDADLAETNTK